MPAVPELRPLQVGDVLDLDGKPHRVVARELVSRPAVGTGPDGLPLTGTVEYVAVRVERVRRED